MNNWMNGQARCMLSTLSVLVPHLYSSRIELLIEFPNKHPFMQKALISKVSSIKSLWECQTRELASHAWQRMASELIRIFLVFKVISWPTRVVCTRVACPLSLPQYCSKQLQLFWLVFYLFHWLPSPNHHHSKTAEQNSK